MLAYLIRRSLLLLLVLFGALVLVFLAVRSIPGNPAEIMAGPERTPEEVASLMAQWGFDRPLPEQFAHYIANVVTGDLGRSVSSRRPVTQELAERLPLTVAIATIALIIGGGVGVLVGIRSALHRGGLWDRVATIGSLTGVSIPSFWIALMLMTLFAAQLGWLPAVGIRSPAHFVLPVATLMLEPLAIAARQTRSAMLEVLGQDYIRTARSKGLSAQRVIRYHALRNAAIPVVTVLGLAWGSLLSGSIIVESVFGIPGLGKLTVDAIAARDYPMLQGVAILFAILFGLSNLLVDVFYVRIDPRVRVS